MPGHMHRPWLSAKFSGHPKSLGEKGKHRIQKMTSTQRGGASLSAKLQCANAAFIWSSAKTFAGN
eukprot:32756-Eustigmatos_ZCMA.PRE.1